MYINVPRDDKGVHFGYAFAGYVRPGCAMALIIIIIIIILKIFMIIMIMINNDNNINNVGITTVGCSGRIFSAAAAPADPRAFLSLAFAAQIMTIT